MSDQIFATARFDELSGTGGQCETAGSLPEFSAVTRSPEMGADRIGRLPAPVAFGAVYLSGVALAAAATVALFFGAGLFLIAVPGGEMISGMPARSGFETGSLADGHPGSAASDREPMATSPEMKNSAVSAAVVGDAAEEGPIRSVQAGELPEPDIAVELPPVHAAPSGPAATARVPSGPGLTAVEIIDLLERGDRLLRTGDVASARLFYERAAAAGDGRAALRLGVTFDPAFLERIGIPKEQADAAAAGTWFGRARDLGVPEAKRQLDNLDPKEGR